MEQFKRLHYFHVTNFLSLAQCYSTTSSIDYHKTAICGSGMTTKGRLQVGDDDGGIMLNFSGKNGGGIYSGHDSWKEMMARNVYVHVEFGRRRRGVQH